MLPEEPVCSDNPVGQDYESGCPRGCQHSIYRSMRLHFLDPSFLRGETLVPEQSNRGLCNEVMQCIDGCSLKLCMATLSMLSSSICHRNKVNSTLPSYIILTRHEQ